ncbi:hypothetical protein GQ600_14878 [Phytophthora cactorum]|nr:hypothetical protein GQ600_14878 [Phytophthora cactorum]
MNTSLKYFRHDNAPVVVQDHRRYDARQDSRGRSPSGWRPRSRVPSPRRYRRSPSPAAAGRNSARSQSPRHWRSSSRYRDRSPSPPPRGEMSPRRPRSRSPPSNYTVEVPENRRRRLLAEKVMSLEMYHRLLQDPKSPWTKTSGIGTTAIPVPLAPNENTGDYQQKFEFWLAQRNVTLASLRDNVIQERNYRCGYAQWRVQKTYGRPPARKSSSAYDRQRSRSRSLERIVSIRLFAHAVLKRTQHTNANPRATIPLLQLRQRRVLRDFMMSVVRRLKQLESIVSQRDLPREFTFNGRSSSSYELYGNVESSPGDSSPTFIDLTDDVDVEVDAGSDPIRSEENENNELAENVTENHSRSVEITPTDSDTNHEGPPTAEDLDEPIAEPGDDLESKSPPKLMLLINAYNQLNDGVLTKQKEEDNMVTDMELGIDDKTNSVKLRSQIYKLRDAIKRQKDKRDAAIAAIIVHTHAEKHAELEQQLQKIAASGVSNEQEDLHDKCAGIAAKLAEKDKELARLQKQLLSLSSLPMSTEESDGALGKREAHELSNKIRLEQVSKASLETERQKVVTRLMKSSRQIQALVTKELSSFRNYMYMYNGFVLSTCVDSDPAIIKHSLYNAMFSIHRIPVYSKPIFVKLLGVITKLPPTPILAPPAKISLDEYLSMLKNKQRQPTQEPLVTRAAVSRGNNSKATIAGSNALLIKRKRNTEDNREEMSPIGESNKRVCSGSFTTLAAHISKRCSSPDSHQSKPVSCKPTNATTTSTISYQKRKPDHVHGGNILTDGCCCRQCVRKWTCKMMNRLKFLGDEVTSLRQLVRLGRHSKLSFQPSTTTTPPASAEPNANSELHTQLDELRVYIGVEKIKRDEAVAAVIAQRWSAKKNEFGLLLESMTAKSKPRAEKAFHEECAEIAGQLEQDNLQFGRVDRQRKILEREERQRHSIPKYAMERTAKSILERQRDDIFMFLIRSSPRIHLLTKVKLDETIKET